MNQQENQAIQGKLLNAVDHGGMEALWSIARGRGATGEAARETLELVTSPLHDGLSPQEAILIVTNKVK